MKTDNNKKDELSILFQQIKWDAPSEDFEQNLMRRIEEVAAEKRKKQSHLFWLSLACICTAFCSTILIALYLLGVDFMQIALAIAQGLGSVNMLYVSVLMGMVLLLFINALVRKRLDLRQ